jgi:hypothetical protein
MYDREHGQAVNADFLVPVHADVLEIDVSWVDEPDFNFNSDGMPRCWRDWNYGCHSGDSECDLVTRQACECATCRSRLTSC